MLLSLPSFQHALGWLQNALGLIGAVFTVLGIVAATPYVVAKARLIRERNEARDWANTLQGRLAAQSADITGILEIAGELRREMVEMRKTQVVSARYIAQLILHIRKRGTVATMPQPPVEIGDAVLDELRAHELEADAAVQGASGVVAPAAP